MASEAVDAHEMVFVNRAAAPHIAANHHSATLNLERLTNPATVRPVLFAIYATLA